MSKWFNRIWILLIAVFIVGGCGALLITCNESVREEVRGSLGDELGGEFGGALDWALGGGPVARSGQKCPYAFQYEEVEGVPYYYGLLGRPADKGWIEDEGAHYYCTGGGKLATGWNYIDDKAYYFYEETTDGGEAGEQAGDDEADAQTGGDAAGAQAGGHRVGEQAFDYTTSGKIVIPASGYLEGTEALAIGYALDVLNRFGWTLRDAYKYSGSLGFVRNPEEVYGFKITNCAVQGFKYGKGNCLSWAGSFCVMAKVMGYDCRLVWGTLPYRGEDVPHGWCEIWEEDGIHVYDPRRNDGADFSGFDGRYGAKRTWKYNEDSRQYLDW